MDLYDNALEAWRASRNTLVIAAGLELVEIVSEFFGQMEHFTTEATPDDEGGWRLSITDISVEGWDLAVGYDAEGRWEHSGWTPRKHFPFTDTEREAWDGLMDAAEEPMQLLAELTDDFHNTRVRWSRKGTFTFETKES